MLVAYEPTAQLLIHIGITIAILKTSVSSVVKKNIVSTGTNCYDPRMQKSLTANLFLLLTAIIWGATFPLIHNAVAYIDPTVFVWVRFLLAAIVLVPFIITTFKQTNWDLLLSGAILGVINAIAYLSQTIGLQTTHSAKAAFITGTYVIIVPFLLPLFRLGKPTRLECFATLIAVAGLYVLTGADFVDVNTGDLWILLSAIFTAIGITYLQRITKRIANFRLLAFYQILFTVPLPLLMTTKVNTAVLLNHTVLISLLFCAVFATSLALFLQTKYQKYTTATKAALIFCMEPIFASIFSSMFNNEPLTNHIIIGGLIILLSLMIPILLPLLKNRGF